MRDQRFVARHRGGLLDIRHHRLLAAWAADCAEHVLPYFLQHSDDDSPRRAIEAARAWARGEIRVGTAQKASLAAHAAAREVKRRSLASSEAARAAGHAVATAHMADHALGGALYGLKCVKALGLSGEAERSWQLAQLPQEVRELAISALHGERLGKVYL